MNATTSHERVDVTQLGPLSHREAMGLAAAEYQRMIDLLGSLDTDQWSRQTDCDLWDVRDMVAHVTGAMAASASVRVNVGQLRAARARANDEVALVDALCQVQIEQQGDATGPQLVAKMAELAASSVKGRRRIPAPIRALPLVDTGPPYNERWKVGYFVGTILTRDVWMHRIDVSRATATEMVLTAEHDGRLVADIVAEWARRHGSPFELTLSGAAGGRFGQGTGGEQIELDAVEFCRILSGRDHRDGLLATEVPF
jgi:uncharacterized protein (TIGR03083 family)